MSSKWYTTGDVQAELKAAGFGAGQVSVRKSSSERYIMVSIKRGQEAKVDEGKLKDFLRTLDSWSMDITDYVQGQSIRFARPKWRPGD